MRIFLKPPRTAALLGVISLFLVTGAVALGQSPDLKIEPGLLTTLTEDAGARASFFVHFKDRAELSAAAGAPGWVNRGTQVVAALQSTARGSQAGAIGYLRSRNEDFQPFWVINAIYIKDGSLGLARALAARPEVAAIEAERIYSIPPVEIQGGAAVQANQWNITKVRAPEVWPTTTGTGIVVANIDTGVRSSHEILAGRNYRGLFYDPTGICPSSTTPCDNNGHGTHTMGTIAGANGYGVAPGAQWIACKGCATNSCSGSHLISCAQWIMAPGGSAANRPHVVNNSWGGGGGDTWFLSYVNSWRGAGIFPAFSAGNTGPSCSTAGSPGDYDQSFASGATDASDVIASFSSRGPSLITGGGIKPDVSAPGVSILSSYNASNISYAYASGTSMASPHTAGSVALLWAAQPALKGNVAGTEQRLTSTAVKLTTSQTCGGLPVGASPNNSYGSGRIDIFTAAAPAPVNRPPTVTITAPANGATFACPATVSFSGSATDPENGNITANIRWLEGGSQLGTGGSAQKAYACTSTGSHTVTATVTDSGGLSDTKSVQFTIYSSTTPLAPTLSASIYYSTVTLRWNDVANETRYNLQRKLSTDLLWGTVNSNILANTINYNQSLTIRGTYQYRIQACNGTSCSAWSNIASVVY